MQLKLNFQESSDMTVIKTLGSGEGTLPTQIMLQAADLEAQPHLRAADPETRHKLFPNAQGVYLKPAL